MKTAQAQRKLDNYVGKRAAAAGVSSSEVASKTIKEIVKENDVKK
ncbi:hypothetical protein [Flavihumibacter profundi]|nr:hypothetical protein [Flavihumibacter profundi]